jgi:hypothetical protein
MGSLHQCFPRESGRVSPGRDERGWQLLTGGNKGNEMMARADSGELKLSEVSETYCSGSFMGKGTDATGNKYTYEGKFSRIKAFRQE